MVAPAVTLDTPIAEYTKSARAAVDFESFYSAKHNVETLGLAGYLQHPETDIYLVSIVTDEFEYVGPLSDAPWHLIDGGHWYSHNAAFDAAAFIEAKRRGLIPEDIAPAEWDCTANMSAFVGGPRSLAGASYQLLGELLDKTVRDEMKGKRWAKMTPEFRERVEQYALRDGQQCLKLADKLVAHIPPHELSSSRHTMMMTLRGINVDQQKADESLQLLEQALAETRARIPWGNLMVKGKLVAVASRNRIAEECAKMGIPAPKSTADKNEAFELWLDMYGDRAPFVQAVKDYRSISRTIEVMRKMKDQVGLDGRLQYGLKYFGAHTGRFSGSGGLNLHNLTKKKVFGVDLRGVLIPSSPDHKFVVVDLKQIEAIVALWFAQDWETLRLTEAGMDLYEAHARRFMGYADPRPLEEYVEAADCPENQRNMRQFAKCRVLGLGFGMGHIKFVQTVKQWTGLNITPGESKEIVRDFRRKNKGILNCWEELDNAMRRHVGRTEPFEIILPSGRALRYFDLNTSGGLRARDEMGGIMLHFYGGKLFENVVQATARDILAEAVLRIEAAGYPVVLHVHDEVIVDVPKSVPKEVIRDLMVQRPAWAQDLPIRSSCKDAERYFK